jgi:hypothetical protein
MTNFFLYSKLELTILKDLLKNMAENKSLRIGFELDQQIKDRIKKF